MRIASWTDFFGAIIGVSAALLSIAFLTFQVRSKVWHKEPLRQVVAVTTLAELAAPLFFGLLVLTPDHPWQMAGILIGSAGYAVMAWHIVVLARHRTKIGSFDKLQAYGLLVTGPIFSLMLWYSSLAVKSYVCVWLIFSGASESWIFLNPPGAAREKERTRDVVETEAA